MRRVLRAETRAHGRRVEVTQVQVAEPVNRDAATRAVTTPPRGPRHSTGSPPAMVTLELGMAHGFVGVLMVCWHESTRCQEGVVWRSVEGLRVISRSYAQPYCVHLRPLIQLTFSTTPAAWWERHRQL